jgi:NtrC-family two-component system response regulator AlgB
VAAGRFRQDLFFRLNVVALELPPLRTRVADILPLATHLLATLAARHRRTPPTLDPEVAAALTAYGWPGNVRELVNVLERALVLSSADVITPGVLPDRVLAPAAPPPPPPGGALSLEAVARAHVQEVLRTSTTLEDAAARLGINPTTLWRKRRRWGLKCVSQPPNAARAGGRPGSSPRSAWARFTWPPIVLRPWRASPTIHSAGSVASSRRLYVSR